MQIQIEAENLDLDQELKIYVQQKFGALEKHLSRLDKKTDLALRVLLERNSRHQSGRVFVCRVRMVLPGRFIKIDERAETPQAAVDLAVARLSRRVQEHKTRWRDITRDRLRRLKRRFQQVRLLRRE